MRCIAVINQKGGVGKTTSTVNIGAGLARAGHRVLLLDVDPQANLSLHLDRRAGDGTETMTEMLVDEVPLADMLHETSTEGLFAVPADTSLSGVETMLANRIGREMILRDAIAALDAHPTLPKFDFILLDCPPSLGVLSANALVAADHVIIPMQAEYFSMQGMTKLMEVMQLVRRALNPELAVALILPCMVDRRTNLTNEVLGELRTHFGDVLAETCIRSNVKLAEAPSFGRTIFEHAPDSNGAHDYEVVTDELLRRHHGTFVPAPPESEDDEEWEEEEDDELEAEEAETTIEAETGEDDTEDEATAEAAEDLEDEDQAPAEETGEPRPAAVAENPPADPPILLAPPPRPVLLAPPTSAPEPEPQTSPPPEGTASPDAPAIAEILAHRAATPVPPKERRGEQGA